VKTYIIFKKDLKSELRNRYTTNSLLMFVIVTISIIRFSLGDGFIKPELLSGLLWITIFFSSVSGLSRVFIKEEDKETSLALKLCTEPISVFTGKLFFNLLLTFAINIVAILLFSIVTGFEIRNTQAFLIVLVLGNLGIVSALTIVAAIVSKANTKGTLYPILSFPVLLPVFLTVVNSTIKSASGAPIGEFIADFQILISYAIVVITASLMLFRFIWEDT